MMVATTVYTDGSATRNGKLNAVGGIGVFFGDGDSRNVSKNLKEFYLKNFPSEKFIKSTNNLSELCAILQALMLMKNNLDKGESVTIVSDSMYSINSLTIWYPNWKKNGWKNAANKPISNKEVMSILVDEYISKYRSNIKFRYVKAHMKMGATLSGDYLGNFNADKLATNAGN